MGGPADGAELPAHRFSGHAYVFLDTSGSPRGGYAKGVGLYRRVDRDRFVDVSFFVGACSGCSAFVERPAPSEPIPTECPLCGGAVRRL